MSTEKRAVHPGREERETVEKAACQLIEIDKPLFRERPHERQPSMSSSQAADRLYPCKPGYSFPPLLLLSRENHGFPWAPRETVVFVGAREKVGLSFVRGAISDVHAAGNDGLILFLRLRPQELPAGGLFRQAEDSRGKRLSFWEDIIPQAQSGSCPRRTGGRHSRRAWGPRWPHHR